MPVHLSHGAKSDVSPKDRDATSFFLGGGGGGGGGGGVGSPDKSV